MRNVTVSTALRCRDLAEVLADFDARGVGLRSIDNLTRDQLYDDAARGHGYLVDTNGPATLSNRRPTAVGRTEESRG